jgi:hypothetical protein
VELALGAPVDDVILTNADVAESLVALVRRLRAAEWLHLQRHVAATIAPLPLAALMARLAALPESTVKRVTIDPDLPIGVAVVAALGLPEASSMRDRLRSVTWA